MRLSTRLAGAFVLVAVCAIGALAGLTLLAARSEISGLADSQRQQTVRDVAGALRDAYRSAGTWASADLQPAYAVARSGGAQLRVADASGASIVGSGPGRGPGAARHAGGETRVAAIVVDGARVGTATVRFLVSGLPDQERRLRDALVRRVLVAVAVAVLIALLVAASVSRRITRPLARLRDAVGRLERGDHGARAGTSAAPGEIGELAAAFDRMGDALAREDELRRTLTADVAHELRTPLTILRGHCEALVDGVEEPTPERLASLHEEVLRLGRIVEDVEALAAAEAAGLGLRDADVDLAEVAGNIVELLRPQFEAGEVELRAELEPVVVRGDADRLAQVVSNLLANASKFTPAGGHVVVSLRRDGARAVLRVADDGAGIPADELAHVFTRFWRGRGAAAVGGSGIGLAVVDELVRAHGGTVEVAAPSEGGAVFTVAIPIAAA